MEKAETQFTLSTPIPYDHEGARVEGNFITLVAPNSKVLPLTGVIRNEVVQAVLEAGERAQRAKAVAGSASARSESEELDASDIAMSVQTSPTIDFPTLLEVSRKLFVTKGIALVEGEVQMTQPLLDAMSPDDLEGMIYEYVAAFLLPSWLRT